MNQELSFIEWLETFNRKERFFLIGWTLGKKRFRASKEFLDSISSLIEVEIPSNAFVAMDYHLDWLYASAFLSSGRSSHRNAYPNRRGLVTGKPTDVDLLIAFRKGPLNHVVMVEAKGATGWTNKQARSKAARLRSIFGRNGKRWPSIRPHFVVASPRMPRQLNLSVWPGWMKRPDGSPYWIEMPMPTDLMRPTRYDKNGKPFWKVIEA